MQAILFLRILILFPASGNSDFFSHFSLMQFVQNKLADGFGLILQKIFKTKDMGNFF